MAERAVGGLSEVLLGKLVTFDLVRLSLLPHDCPGASPEGCGILGHVVDVVYGAHHAVSTYIEDKRGRGYGKGNQ